MSVDPDLHPHHPLNLAWLLLRWWLGGLVFLMLITGITARPLALEGAVRPVPYIVIGVTAIIWWLYPRSFTTTAVCAGIISGGLIMRGVEIVLASDNPLNERWTPAALWVFIGLTTAGLGFSISIVIAKRYADIEVWGRT